MRNVLIVDDSPTMRRLIIFSLKKFTDFRIVEAGNGLEALQKIAAEKFGLFLVDINMPEMNGLEFIQNLRRVEGYDRVPIVVITTEGSDEDKRKAFEAGATEYVTKPFQPPALHGIVERALQASEAPR